MTIPSLYSDLLVCRKQAEIERAHVAAGVPGPLNIMSLFHGTGENLHVKLWIES